MNSGSPNPFYRMLIVASTAFAATAFASALVPWDDQPPWLREHGWKLLLIEVAAVIILGLASMGLDHAQRKK